MGKQKDFVAISILCMYPNKATACSVGLVKVKNNEVVDEFHSLISPPAELKFAGFNMVQSLHGITEEQTDGEPTFIELLPKMEEFIGELPLVVHNGIVEYWAFIRALEHYREKGFEVSSYLERKPLIDTSRMYESVPFYKRYNTLHDARLYAEFYIAQDEEDVLYPKVAEKKRPDVTQEYMAAVKRKEKVSPEVYEAFDYSTAKMAENPYYEFGVFITGETDVFTSKTDLYLFLRNELGIHPCKSPLKGCRNILVVCSRGAGAGRIKTAKDNHHIITSEEELLDELSSLGLEPPVL